MSTPIIIGLTGLAGSGKDTVADTLVTHAGFNKVAFADALRLEIAGAYRLGANSHILSERGTKEVPLEALRLWACNDSAFVEKALAYDYRTRPARTTEADLLKPRSPRWVMQVWGTEYRRAQQPNYWTTKLAMHVAAGISEGRDRWVITDCRFQNEAACIRTLGGEIWQVVRPGLAPVAGAHVSETEGHEFAPASTLINGTTVIGLMHTTLRALVARHGGVVVPNELGSVA